MESKNTADRENTTECRSAYFKENPTAPVRILVSTATHLVPGSGFFERTAFMRNLISQYHWNRNFEGCDRFEAYNATFGYDNRKCYFLLDHGQSPDGNDEIVPILSYQWTGTLLNLNREALPSQIQKTLKKFPFTPKPVPRTEPRQISEVQRRKNIRAKLNYDMGLSIGDVRFLKENPEHLAWLEINLEKRLWKVLEAQIAHRIHPDLLGDKQTTQVEKGKLSDCTEMWDCECFLCSS